MDTGSLLMKEPVIRSNMGFTGSQSNEATVVQWSSAQPAEGCVSGWNRRSWKPARPT